MDNLEINNITKIRRNNIFLLSNDKKLYCDTCKEEYTLFKKLHHEKSKKHIDNLNKKNDDDNKIIKEYDRYKNKVVKCDICEEEYKYYYMALHNRSKRHLNNLLIKNNIDYNLINNNNIITSNNNLIISNV